VKVQFIKRFPFSPNLEHIKHDVGRMADGVEWLEQPLNIITFLQLIVLDMVFYIAPESASDFTQDGVKNIIIWSHICVLFISVLK
jgi:hypothetical protein